MAAKRISNRPGVKLGASKQDEAEVEVGRLLAHCARLERELADLRALQKAQQAIAATAPGKTAQPPPSTGGSAPKRPGAPIAARKVAEAPSKVRSDRPTPMVSASLPPQEAIATIREGLKTMREVLVSAAAQVDAFAKKEFDLFDPRVKPLLLLRTMLLKAAGENARVPPPMPSIAPNPIIDISDLAEALESLRPNGGDSLQVLTFPPPPKLGIPTE
jgi:hypothetical protein